MTETSCKFCKNDLLIEVGKIVECPNGCIPCSWCGNLLWDNQMQDSDGAIDGMHVDCAGDCEVSVHPHYFCKQCESDEHIDSDLIHT